MGKFDIRKIRREKVTRSEIVADVIFFIIPAVLSFLIIFFFDIHHSFYPGNTLFPPDRIFINYDPYWFWPLLGGVAGFFLIKLFLFGLKEEGIEKKRK